MAGGVLFINNAQNMIHISFKNPTFTCNYYQFSNNKS